ncbi:MAG: ABC transporter permease [Bacteroidetes bacterium]|nr:MAG: ABC transporter permease [Bacteroidota bacterium]
MRILATLLVKEFKQIFRNRFMLPVIFILPVVQMVLLTYAASLEMKDIRLSVVDQDLSAASRLLVSRFRASPFFSISHAGQDYGAALAEIRADRVDVVLQIPAGFEQKLYREGYTELELTVNAINATEAGLINFYCSQIVSSCNAQIRTEFFGHGLDGGFERVDMSSTLWYNPLIDYKIYMFSGILVILVTMIALFLTALNLVREKEMGTTEQINVTPIRKYQFIVAKLLPFWLIAIFELAFGLVVGRLLYNLPMVGSLGLLFLLAAVYILLILGFGLFLSTVSQTQQQLMFVAYFFMITFILMSGVFTPVEAMPEWARKVNVINPVAYFMKVIRMILLKGSDFVDVAGEFYRMLVYAAVMLSLAVLNYRKTS